MNALDMNTLPKSTPVGVRKLVAEMSGELSHLRTELARLQQADAQANADHAIAKVDEHIVDDSVFDRINHRTNAYGEVLNCRIAENCAKLNLRIASEALGRTLASRHSDVRTDKSGRRWIDFYPATSAAPANIMEQPEPEPTVADFDDDFPF